MTDAMFILEGAEETDQQRIAVGGGDAFLYTSRAPDKGTVNEDTLAVIPYGPQAAVLVVADGAGGLPAGKRASFTAVTSLNESLQQSMAETMLLRTAILNGIEAANEAVQAIGNGSATTLTVLTIEGRAVRAYQVGDSQGMVIGLRGLVRLQTTPHSPTGFAVEAGFLDQKAALHHDERHLVSNFIGSADMRIDVGAEIELQSRDTVLLASDGLMDNVHHDEIIERARKGPLDDAVQRVVSLARHRMGSDSTSLPSKPDDLSLILFRKPVATASPTAEKQ